MTLVIILAAIIVPCIGFYWLISEEIEPSNDEIMNELKCIEKQNNQLREEINELRLQLDEMWKDIKYIKNNIDNKKD